MQSKPTTFRVNINLSPSDFAMLRRDAHLHLMNMSDYIRFLIRQEHKKAED